MDKRKSILNVSVSIASRSVLLVASLLVRRLLIQRVGSDVNGLNSLYASIISMLAVAELGIGSAIAFSMYKPIVEGDGRQVSALYRLYARLYRIVGAIIFAAGLAVMPFLPRIIGDYEALDVDVYRTFLLTLVAAALTYLYGAKTSLIEAHKDNWLTTGIVAASRMDQDLTELTPLSVCKTHSPKLNLSLPQPLFHYSPCGIGSRTIPAIPNLPDIISAQ